jgi:putative transposase
LQNVGGEGSWDDFVRRHAASLWACDFFSKKVRTVRRLVDVFVLFFPHVGSRRVHVAGLSAQPDRAWVARQARDVSMVFAERPEPPKVLPPDHDAKFVQEFDQVLEADGVEVKRVGPRAPNRDASAARRVRSAKQECLGHVVVCGEGHLRHILSRYAAHANHERPHQARDNRPPSGGRPTGDAPRPSGAVVCEERPGGLLKHVRRAA